MRSLKQLKTLSRLSPTSVKVSYRQVREGGMLHSLADCLNMEYRLVRRCCEDRDFYEGVSGQPLLTSITLPNGVLLHWTKLPRRWLTDTSPL